MTPEERIKKLMKALQKSEADLTTKSAGWALDGLLNYLDDHEDPNERALGQMLRNGVTSEGHGTSFSGEACEFYAIASLTEDKK